MTRQGWRIRCAGRPAFRAALLMLVLGHPPVMALQDPTRPADFRSAPAAVAAQTTFKLASIMIGNHRRTAVINGEPRREGQRFHGVRLQRIHPDRVEILDQGRVRVIRLEALPQVRGAQ